MKQPGKGDENAPDFVTTLVPKMLGEKSKRPTAEKLLAEIRYEKKP